MVDLGKYAVNVLSAWGLSLGALAILSLVTWVQARKARRALQEAEERLKARKEAAK